MAMAGKYPIVRGAQTLTLFFDRLQQLAPPNAEKFRFGTWLAQSGLKSSHFDAIPSFAKFIGIVNESGPTESWAEIRSNERHGPLLLALLKKAYAEPLGHFSIDAAAPEHQAQLVDWIKATERVDQPSAESAVETMIRAFDRALGRESALAPVPRSASRATPAAAGGRNAKATVAPPATRTSNASRPTGSPRTATVLAPAGSIEVDRAVALTINLSLQIPPTENAAIYDALFASMSKHLKGLLSTGPGHEATP